MAADGKFSSETVLTLSRRAALLCSNPDCETLTCGPAEETTSSINIGEAAHIYGRTTASARHKADLSLAELSDITNGIWLCRNCHKLIDNDPVRFPAELLFEWRRLHEKTVSPRVGQPGDRLREGIQAEQLHLFNSASRFAQQIVLDRPPMWELKLTAELLRSDLGPIYQRWQQLKLGMYVRKSTIIPDHDLPGWFAAKFDDVAKFAQVLMPLVKALNEAFGPPGQPGNDKDILAVCNLIVAMAKNLLEWEEDIRFIHVAEKFRDILSTLQGVTGRQLDQLLRIPNELSDIVALEKPESAYQINLVLTMPDDFLDNFKAALKRALAAA
jgi:hypothetical protein